MEEKNIDRTHIIALQEVCGQLRNVEMPISRPMQFIADAEAMVDNPNRTVWDLQSHFMTRYPKDKSYLDYIHPYGYRSTFVDGIDYPKMREYNELRDSWVRCGNKAREKYMASCKENGTAPDATIALQQETKEIDDLKKRQKVSFMREAMRWVDARCYYDAAEQLHHDSSVKMFSKENIGWTDFIHRVNDDIKVAIKTNFGYGSSSYFILAVQYKGIDILPYSYIVKYYKAGMADIVRCTRSYTPCRESWTASFDFLADFVNKSIANPKGFVESYIMNEVEEMMHGLEAIAINPESIIKQIGNRQADPCVINVRPMFRDEKTRMQSYPEETPILFKVEKIIGALDFLNNLSAIAKEVDRVQPHIDRLLELNMTLYPEIREAIKKVTGKVTEQTSIKEELQRNISAVAEKLIPFENEIEQLRVAATPKQPFILSKYEASHMRYRLLKNEKANLYARYCKACQAISDFNSFLDILNRSLSKVDEVRERQHKDAA